jgi:hypothetical protein
MTKIRRETGGLAIIDDVPITVQSLLSYFSTKIWQADSSPSSNESTVVAAFQAGISFRKLQF